MVAEVFAGLSAIKTAFDIAKGLKDIDTAASRNAAVIELQEKILAAREAQTALLDRIGELEKEMARFETWEAEKKRYKLTDFGAGTFAYSLKPEEANGEPPHRICAACYQKNRNFFFPTGLWGLCGVENIRFSVASARRTVSFSVYSSIADLVPMQAE
jgi:hypothetical protein